MSREHLSQLDPEETEALQAIGWRPATEYSACPDSSLLVAVENGALDDGLAERVRAHVQSCVTCQLLAKDLASVLAEDPTVDEAAAIRTRVLALAKPTRGSSSVWIGLGGLALAAGLAGVFLWPRPVTPPPAETQIAKTTVTPVPTVFGIDRPAIPPGEIDLAVRGDATTPRDVNNQAALALDRADSGDVKGAIAELEALVRKNPSSRKAGLALGALQLREARDTEALASLERIRPLKTAPEMDDEVDWYLAIARIRAGDRPGARALLEIVCKRNGARGARACAGVTEIDRLPSVR